MNNQKRYNYDLLNKYIYDNNIKLCEDYKNNNINRDTIIKALCNNCGENFEKNFRSFFKNFNCKKCVIMLKKDKVKETNIKKFGVENPMQNQYVKNKSKNTCMEKYGCSNPMQNEDVKNKLKATCLEKYGAECSLKNEVVKEKIFDTNIKLYGFKNPSKNSDVKEKTKQTCLKKLNCEFPMQNEDVKTKFKNTCMDKYNCENPFQNIDVKDKIKQTNIQKYGCEYPIQNQEIKNKINETNIEKYGFSIPTQNEEVKEKIKHTCLQRYGVENVMHVSEIAEKTFINSCKNKDYILPSKKIIKIQGYENFALDELLYKENIKEVDIYTSRNDMPIIWYNFNGEKHRYYPDIYIISQNKCIEVKSEYTVKCAIDINKLKAEATKSICFYEMRVYDKKGCRIDVNI